jgi:hypothetical protein
MGIFQKECDDFDLQLHEDGSPGIRGIEGVAGSHSLLHRRLKCTSGLRKRPSWTARSGWLEGSRSRHTGKERNGR